MQISAKPTSMRNTYGDTLVKLGATHKILWCWTLTLQSPRRPRVLEKRIPTVFDMGIAEQDLMGTAAVAASGMSVFASTLPCSVRGPMWNR